VKILKYTFLALALFSVTACSSSGPTSPSNPAYTQTLPGTVSLFGTTRHALSIPRSGNMRLTLTWTGSTNLDLYLAPASCQNLYPLAQCGVLVTSNSATGSQEVITRGVTSGEAYAIFVDNLSLVAANTYTLNIEIN
jgi:hypothetical protein